MVINTVDAEKRLCQYFSNIDRSVPPVQRPMSEWCDDNKLGFLLGVLSHHPDSAEEIFNLFDPEAELTEETSNQYLDDMYDLHIGPFKQYGPTGSLYVTPCDSASSVGSASPIFQAEVDHSNLKAALVDRACVCLFCWIYKPWLLY
ncbi:hypothetical protein BJ741DRAFT_252816 [Chytriomyces cf. hyalinus JEL632]|nr:hypothetical protein BJ741DRAFT_252816 [Chytriomyces cf. hyalinus JEL632]